MILALIFWIFNIFFLYLFGISYLFWSFAEGALIKLPEHNAKVFILIIISLFLMVIFTFFGIGGYPIYFLATGLIILGWVVYLILIAMEKKKRLSDKKEELKSLELSAENNEEDIGLNLRLAKRYEELGRINEALKFYRKVKDIYPENIRTDTHMKIEELEFRIKSEKDKKPLKCKRCNSPNRQDSFFCEKCGKILHSSYIKYLKEYAPAPLKVGIAWFLISSIIIGFTLSLWFNAIFYILVLVDIIIIRRITKSITI